MAWQHLDSAAVAGATLDLYGDDAGHFMIRANGLELMSSRAHASEDGLGALAVASAGGGCPRILIGGLGLGFTAEAVWRGCPAARITVAEISGAVIGWYRQRVAPGRGVAVPDGVDIVCGDVRGLLRPEAFEVIALDVDNGPEAFTTPDNDALYTLDGLAQLRAALSAKGTALVWSGFASDAFGARAAAAGFGVNLERIALPQHGRTDHFVYVLRKD